MSSRGDRIWIQGAGELASGVALRLIRCGYRVILAELPQPRAVRRQVCFAQAVFAGRAVVEEVAGRLVASERADWRRGEATVVVDPEAEGLERLQPVAVVDARMRKKRPEKSLLRTGVPVLGLGPGFLCGRDAVFVIETQRGARLGAVLDRGEADPDTGVPAEVRGESARRVLRSPAPGRLLASRQIGDLLRAGDVVGTVNGVRLTTEIDGLLRGLIHPAVELFVGEKVGDVDPRGATIDPLEVSDKSLAVAGGVLEALLRLGIRPQGTG